MSDEKMPDEKRSWNRGDVDVTFVYNALGLFWVAVRERAPRGKC